MLHIAGCVGCVLQSVWSHQEAFGFSGGHGGLGRDSVNGRTRMLCQSLLGTLGQRQGIMALKLEILEGSSTQRFASYSSRR